MPDRDKPRFARIGGAALCITGYVMCLGVAAGDALFPSTTIDGVLPTIQITLSVTLLVVLASLGLVAVCLHRWRWEFVPANVLVFVVLARAYPVLVSLPDVPTRLSAASMMVMGATALGHRALGLWVFAVKTKAVALRARQWRTR